MSDKSDVPAKKNQIDQRAKRRSDQLRANLMRRKAQIRSRRSGEEDARGEGLPAAQPVMQVEEEVVLSGTVVDQSNKGEAEG